jgi:KipI family sensor histidine kinase inhibitor
VLPVGDAAATLELGDRIDPELAARVRALDRRLAGSPFPGLREAVPSYRALLALYDPAAAGFDEVGAALLERWSDTSAAPEPHRVHRIPTRYGGDDGPDLEALARARGLTPEEVVERHAALEYTAFMLGFMPGFAYLGLVDPALETPRLATPRLRVPAGSVGIAGRQTAVYPRDSPGGWSLIGRSSLRFFDPVADPPALVLPGDRVRFLPVRELPPLSAPPPASSRPCAPALELLHAGLLTTVQAAERRGLRRFGVAGAGALDAPALRAGNLLVGNPEDAAGLECTIDGPALRFHRAAYFALTGADLGAVLERGDLGEWPVPSGLRVLARPGHVLRFRGRRSGARAYLAFAGGIEVPALLGSRSTDLAAGFGGFEGRALRAGDALALGAWREAPRLEAWRGGEPAARARVRAVPGPQHDHFDAETLQRFFAQEWRLGAASDRVGCRLEGEPLAHLGPAEITSDGMLPGCVQVPPDGRPIVMLGDSPTTGGYPKIATVVSGDLPLLAQLPPGEGQVRFERL